MKLTLNGGELEEWSNLVVKLLEQGRTIEDAIHSADVYLSVRRERADTGRDKPAETKSSE